MCIPNDILKNLYVERPRCIRNSGLYLTERLILDMARDEELTVEESSPTVISKMWLKDRYFAPSATGVQIFMDSRVIIRENKKEGEFKRRYTWKII